MVGRPGPGENAHAGILVQCLHMTNFHFFIYSSYCIDKLKDLPPWRNGLSSWRTFRP